MSGNALDGTRRDLRQAILASFNSDRLVLFLKDIEFPCEGGLAESNLAARIDSLIDLASQSGWLIRLCRELEAVPKDQTAHVRIVRIRKALISRDPRKLTVVLSSHGTERGWAQNLLEKGGFFKALDPCDDPIDTRTRSKLSEDGSVGLAKEIDTAKLIVGVISKRYIGDKDSVREFERAFGSLVPSLDGRPPARYVLALAADQDGRNWLTEQQDKLDPICRPCLIVEEFFEGDKRKSIESDGATDYAVRDQVRTAGERMRAYFDALPEDSVLPVPLPEPVKPPLAVMPGAVIILGEPAKASEPDATSANDELAKELAGHNVVVERWGDDWRQTKRSIGEISNRPVFVRTILDKSQSSAKDVASRLSSDLNVAFGYQYDDESENVRPLINCPRVLWRPHGPDWALQATEPSYSRSDQPSAFGRWLAELLGKIAPASAMVYYEDDLESARRGAIAKSLVSAVANKDPPLDPDAVSFEPDRVINVLNSVGERALTVIAAHDLSTTKSREATIARFRLIDQQIQQTLDRKAATDKRLKNARLMRVAVLIRNADEFDDETEFTQKTWLQHWGMLKISKNADGTYEPNEYSLKRLRSDVADLARRRA